VHRRSWRVTAAAREELLAVVVAEQEREAGQVDAKLSRVVAVNADEATERGGELAVASG
jgi:hypothetical protein